MNRPPMSARDRLQVMVRTAPGSMTVWSEAEARDALDAYRAEVLAEAIEAARGEYLTDGTGTDEDNAYNNGITDAVAAIGRLTEGGAR